MTDKFTSNNIASLYRDGATEQPSSALDQQILQNAVNAVQPKVKSKRFYQTWYGRLSTAASLMLVSLLYWQNTDQFTSVNDLPALEPDANINSTPVIKRSERAAPASLLAEPMADELKLEVQTELLRSRSMKKQAPANDFAVTLKQVDMFLAKGQPEEAKLLLIELLEKYPEQKVQLAPKYKELLGNNMGLK
ncbi:hypothetical protein AMS58_16830 [Pseudoalteromonas porphyrae]|uniref:hypothetical protein n=1 Tax=Pseudoalteromonas TaxID=53246 RepID=UPI0006BB035A|nr:MULTISPECIES: hypothetical protein [Pseudoalteromonas]KPH93552.1 hypothetical protein AMS58_16830 [Pseudoalteromonas porphyrae]